MMPPEQSQVIEAQERDLDFRMYQERGGSAIDLLELAIPLLEKEKALPDRIRVDLVRYLKRRLVAEKKDNLTDRDALRRKKLQTIRDAKQIEIRSILTGKSKAAIMRDILAKRNKLEEDRGLSEDTLKQRIKRHNRRKA